MLLLHTKGADIEQFLGRGAPNGSCHHIYIKKGQKSTFLKNLSKMPFKKGQISLLFCLKLFEYPQMKFNNFKSSFYKFFYSGLFLFKFCSFLLARYLIWKYFSLSSIWNYIYMYIYIYIYIDFFVILLWFWTIWI